MSKLKPKGMYKTIDRSAMDALLYALSKSLEYLGEQERVIFDEMADLMLGYLIEVGKVKHPDKPKQFAHALDKLLIGNGYSRRIPLKFKGTPPTPSFSNFVDYLMPNASQRARDKREWMVEGKSSGKRKVDWVLYEMVLYGMTKALDQLGAQAQLMLNRIGSEMLDYLISIEAIQPSDDVEAYQNNIVGFFMKAGYARSVDIEYEGSPPHTMLVTYKDARYYNTVLRRLRNEGSILFSCPMCIAGQSMLNRATGIRIEFAGEFRLLPGGKAFVRSKLHGPVERFTEEDATQIAQMTA